jgi:type I restriction enzyme S subunit
MSFPRYPAYKHSGVEWLGEVPAHWSVVPLKHLVTLRSGGTPSKDRLEYWDGSIPWASAKDLKVERLFDTQDHITEHAVSEGAAGLVPTGSVLVVVRGMILAKDFPVSTTAVPMAINQDLKALTCGALLETNYLARLLVAASAESSRVTDEAGHGTKALRMETWTAIRLPVPSAGEQRAIAAFLDRETAKIDALVAEQKKLIELLKETRQAVISNAVTKGLDPNVPMKDSGVEWLGEVPAHWDVFRLRFTAELNPSKSEAASLPRDAEVSFLPMESVGDDGSLDLSRAHPITELENGYTYFREGDVTVAKITPCFENGKGAVMRGLRNGIGFGTTELIVARPRRGVMTSNWLNLIFRSQPFRRLGEAAMYGAGGQKRVPDDFVREFRIGVPPIAEQTAIAAFLDRETAKIDTLVVEAQGAIALLKERRSALISAAVTGQIDVRGLSAEQATAAS